MMNTLRISLLRSGSFSNHNNSESGVDPSSRRSGSSGSSSYESSSSYYSDDDSESSSGSGSSSEFSSSYESDTSTGGISLHSHMTQTERGEDKLHDHRRSSSSGANDEDDVKKLALKETRAIQAWRVIVLSTILVTGVLVCTGTYFAMRRQEESSSTVAYVAFSETVQETAQLYIINLRNAVQGLSTSITASARKTNSQFPFITVPLFEVLGRDARQQSHWALESLFWSPVVEDGEATSWEDYSASHAQGWIGESWSFFRPSPMEEFTPDNSNIALIPVISPIIHHVVDVVVDQDVPGENGTAASNVRSVKHVNQPSLYAPHLPLWQQSPPPIDPVLINRDWFYSPSSNGTIDSALESAIAQSEEWAKIVASYNDTETTIVSMHKAAPEIPMSTFAAAEATKGGVIAPVSQHHLSSASSQLLTEGNVLLNDKHVAFHQQFVSEHTVGEPVVELNRSTAFMYTPHSFVVQPVMRQYHQQPDQIKSGDEVVGYVQGLVGWDRYLTNLLPSGVDGIYCVVSICGDDFTYLLNGPKATFLGRGDLHDPAFDNTRVFMPLEVHLNPRLASIRNSSSSTVESTIASQNALLEQLMEGDATAEFCELSYTTYVSQAYADQTQSNLPVIVTVCVACVFALVSSTFCIYDGFVQRRNNIVVDAARRSHDIVSSLFPHNVRTRLFKEKANEAQKKLHRGKSKHSHKSKSRMTTTYMKSNLKAFMSEEKPSASSGLGSSLNRQASMSAGPYEGKPIADLFPETTILFADIAGFTAWSSVREPSQVFTLLETVYRAFDDIATRLRVFKVETVGDCYVAVVGLPDPRKDHAVVMARFSRACMVKMYYVTRRLEVILGPDTCDLHMRMGMHSGPVTAGVLRGERSRFQLFGDTMNVAARMESNGLKGKIQLSEETAALLNAAGKSVWVEKRDKKVIAKGKGELQTYWLAVPDPEAENNTKQKKSKRTESMDGSTSREDDDDLGVGGGNAHERAGKPASLTADRIARLVDWNVEVLVRLLKQIVARRNAHLANDTKREEVHVVFGSLVNKETGEPIENNDELEELRQVGKTVIHEVKEIVKLPKFNAKVAATAEDPESIQLNPEVVDQLYAYVRNIAFLYQDNPFHNFEHASHVTMSVTKLLSRIVAPAVDITETTKQSDKNSGGTKTMHDHTYGITSDPLTQFACVFSALIHDVDHYGVPNAQLVKEKARIAVCYNGKSVAEQNSVDLAWQLLMDDSYLDLRKTIYSTKAEFSRFRQLVVNGVMATDIVDKELKELRNARWTKAFSEHAASLLSTVESPSDMVNRKATIVIEHLIQASDVAHTMQHWHIYRKWNERFFLECMKAYYDGRAEKDPSVNWYKGEIGFFDFYIVPLAKKLKNCGVFGVSSDEYLNYAQKNRQEWELRGQEVVEEMMELVKETLGADPHKDKEEEEKKEQEQQQQPGSPAAAATSEPPLAVVTPSPPAPPPPPESAPPRQRPPLPSSPPPPRATKNDSPV